jgi:hypothetical protein
MKSMELSMVLWPGLQWDHTHTMPITTWGSKLDGADEIKSKLILRHFHSKACVGRHRSQRRWSHTRLHAHDAAIAVC